MNTCHAYAVVKANIKELAHSFDVITQSEDFLIIEDCDWTAEKKQYIIDKGGRVFNDAKELNKFVNELPRK